MEQFGPGLKTAAPDSGTSGREGFEDIFTGEQAFKQSG
jgi:hypothetical protein